MSARAFSLQFPLTGMLWVKVVLCIYMLGSYLAWTCSLGCSYSCLRVMPRVWGTWDAGRWGLVGNMSFFPLAIFIIICLNQCIYDVPPCSFHISCVRVNWFLYLCLKGSITFGNFTPSYSSGIFSLISCFFGTPVIYFSILKVVSKLPVAQLIFLPVF